MAGPAKPSFAEIRSIFGRLKPILARDLTERWILMLANDLAELDRAHLIHPVTCRGVTTRRAAPMC